MNNRDERQSYSLAELTTEDYQRLLHVALSYCRSMSLAVRHTVSLSSPAEAILLALAPALVSETETNEWPGTVLLDSAATVRAYRYEDCAVSVLMRATDGLYDWQQPDRPEDLCLYREDGSVWLASIAHERDAYLCLTISELGDLRRDARWLYDLLVVSQQDEEHWEEC